LSSCGSLILGRAISLPASTASLNMCLSHASSRLIVALAVRFCLSGSITVAEGVVNRKGVRIHDVSNGQVNRELQVLKRIFTLAI
jgi:hypothetical protein